MQAKRPAEKWLDYEEYLIQINGVPTGDFYERILEDNRHIEKSMQTGLKNNENLFIISAESRELSEEDTLFYYRDITIYVHTPTIERVIQKYFPGFLEKSRDGTPFIDIKGRYNINFQKLIGDRIEHISLPKIPPQQKIRFFQGENQEY